MTSQNQKWRDDKPTEKQVELFDKLQLQSEYDKEEYPQTKGEYCDAISYMIEKVASNKATRQIRVVDNNWTYLDDDYKGDQGVMPGY